MSYVEIPGPLDIIESYIKSRKGRLIAEEGGRFTMHCSDGYALGDMQRRVRGAVCLS
jgi:hypothetical protein